MNSETGHHDLPDISLTRRSDLGETKIQRSVRKENRRSLVDDLRFSKRQYNLMLKRGITISYDSVSKSSLSNTRHLVQWFKLSCEDKNYFEIIEKKYKLEPK